MIYFLEISIINVKNVLYDLIVTSFFKDLKNIIIFIYIILKFKILKIFLIYFF